MTTFQTLPKIEPEDTKETRLEKLELWCRSLDGYLYSIGSCLTELRKELAELRRDKS